MITRPRGLGSSRSKNVFELRPRVTEKYPGRVGHEEDEQSDHQELFLNSLLTRWQAAEEMEVAHEFSRMNLA